MTNFSVSSWKVPAALVALSIIPVIAGTARLVELAGGAEITPYNARFFAAPLPVVMHVLSVTVYCLVGAFQFSVDVRRRHPGWHRGAGRVLVPMGLVASLSGLWMTQFYPNAVVNHDGTALYGIRLLVGMAMTAFLFLGYLAIRKRKVLQHRAWMMRAYALGLGAGTQVLTHLPWFLFPSIQGEFSRTVFMGAGWFINLAVVEWILAREKSRENNR